MRRPIITAIVGVLFGLSACSQSPAASNTARLTRSAVPAASNTASTTPPEAAPPPTPPTRPPPSPPPPTATPLPPSSQHDSSMLATIRAGNVWLQALDGQPRQLTTDGQSSQPRWSPS